ncbi:MAG: hypothetical protein AAB596_03035 [Patescibacteria group bacterium]
MKKFSKNLLYTPIITLPVGAVNDILGYISQLFTDLSPVILLVIGIILGAIVLEVIIGAIRGK